MKTPLILLLIPLFPFAATNASAATKTWDGSTSASWNVAANWTGGAVPIGGDDLVFPGAALNKAMNNSVAAGTSFKKLTFSGAGYSLTGNGFTIFDATVTIPRIEATHTSGTTTLNLPITLGEGATIAAVAGASIVFGTSSSLTHSTHELFFSGDGAFTLGGTSGGTGGVEFSGTGTLTINSNQNQSGLYNLSGSGVMQLNARVSGPLQVGSGATLRGNNGRTFGACAIGGDLDPGGTSASTFTADGNLSFVSDGTGEEVFFDLHGTAAGSSYDQVNAGGTLTTDDTKIILRPTVAFPIGTTFILFDKFSAGAIANANRFDDSNGIAINEGSQQTAGVNRFQYSYVGGDGNDFTATVVVAPLSATTRTWDGGAADQFWSSGLNWSTDAVPTAGQILNFGGVATADVATVNDLGGNFGRIDFTGAAGGFTISPEDLTLQDLTLSHGIQASHTGAGCSVNNDLVLAASQTFSLTNLGNLTIGAGTATQFNGFNLTVHCASPSGTFALNSGLSGTGNLLKTGPGIVNMGGVGTSSNAYTGTTTVQEGQLRLIRGTITAPANCIPGALLIGGGANPASVVNTQAEKIADTTSVTVAANGSFLPEAAETIGALILDGGTVNSGSHVLSVDGNLTANQDTTITSPLLVKNAIRDWTVAAGKTFALSGPLTYSPLSSGTSVNKKGDGTFVLAGTSGVTSFSLDAGTLQLDNNSATDTIGVLLNGGTLTGSGRAIRITASAGGTVSPATGTATAILEATRLTFNAATTIAFDLNGSTAGTGHDQLDVAQSAVDPNGTVTLGNAVLAIRESFVAPVGTTFTIIRNDLTDGVSGTFSGLAQGAIFLTAHNRYSISYTGGSGNDVVLTVIAPAATATNRVWDGGGAANINWMTAANWAGDVAPGPGDDLEFPAAHATSINNYPAGMTFGSIRFTGVPTATTRSISGNALQLLVNLSSSLDDGFGRQVNISTPITLLSAATITNSGQRHLRFLAALTTTVSPLRLVGDGGATLRQIIFTNSGLISGPARLIVDFNASVDLISGSTHTYSGGTEVKHGRIFGNSEIYANGLTVGDGVNPAFASASNSGFLPAAVVVNANGTLQANSMNCNSLTVNGTPALPATVTATDVTLTTGFTTDAGDTVAMGTLTAPSLTQNGGTLSFTGAVNISGTVRLQTGALTLKNNSSAGRLEVVTAGGVNAGTLTQIGFLSVTDDVTVSGGTLMGAGPGDGLGFTSGGSHPFFVASSAQLNTLGEAAFDDLIEKMGPGTLTVTGALRASSVTVHSGIFHSDAVNGNLVSGQATGITLNGGHLRGNGVFGDLLATSTAGSQVSPGASAGRLTTSGIAVGAGEAMQLNFEINSAVPATGHDQIVVAGSSPDVTLAPGNNATVQVAFDPSFVSPVGTQLVLISNEGANPISGTFAGKPQNFEETVGGTLVRYSYTGGDGNDFTLTLISPPPAGEFRVWDGGGPDANWTTGLNWTGDAAPNPGDSLRFPTGALQLSNSNNYPAGTKFGRLLIEGGYTLGGNNMDPLSSIESNTSASVAFNLPLIVSGDVLISHQGTGALTLNAPIILGANSDLILRRTGASGGDLLLISTITGTSANTVTCDGNGTVRYDHNLNNANLAETRVRAGILRLEGTATVANHVPGDLVIGGGPGTALVRNQGGRILGKLVMETNGTHQLQGATPEESITELVLRGGGFLHPSNAIFTVIDALVAEGGGTRTLPVVVQWNPSSPTDEDIIQIAAETTLEITTPFSVSISNNINNLKKRGPGKLVIPAAFSNAPVNRFSQEEGTTLVPAGGNLSASRVQVEGGLLTGNGQYSAPLNLPVFGTGTNGGTIAPSTANGTGIGLLTFNNSTFIARQGHTFSFEIGGTGRGTGYDSITSIVNSGTGGTFDVSDSTLEVVLTNGFVPTPGQKFSIIVNAISGSNFSGPFRDPLGGSFEEGEQITLDGYIFTITYQGSNASSQADDIELTAVGPVPTIDFTSFTFGIPPGGAAGNQITASITGPAHTLVNLEASSDLINWTVIGSTTMSGAGLASFNITDAAATGSRRFYQVTIP